MTLGSSLRFSFASRCGPRDNIPCLSFALRGESIRRFTCLSMLFRCYPFPCLTMPLLSSSSVFYASPLLCSSVSRLALPSLCYRGLSFHLLCVSEHLDVMRFSTLPSQSDSIRFRRNAIRADAMPLRCVLPSCVAFSERVHACIGDAMPTPLDNYRRLPCTHAIPSLAVPEASSPRLPSSRLLA